MKFAKNNSEIDWNYLNLIINKRLFTMKEENHDTTKVGSQNETHLKGQRMWTNIKLCLTAYMYCTDMCLLYSYCTCTMHIY